MGKMGLRSASFGSAGKSSPWGIRCHGAANGRWRGRGTAQARAVAVRDDLARLDFATLVLRLGARCGRAPFECVLSEARAADGLLERLAGELRRLEVVLVAPPNRPAAARTGYIAASAVALAARRAAAGNLVGSRLFAPDLRTFLAITAPRAPTTAAPTTAPATTPGRLLSAWKRDLRDEAEVL